MIFIFYCSGTRNADLPRKWLHFHQPPCKGFRHEPEASPSHHGRGRCTGRAVRGKRVGPNPGAAGTCRAGPRARLRPSPATSACTANTCSAASRRPMRSPRFRAASTSATRAASTSGTWASNIIMAVRQQSGRLGTPRVGLLRRLQVDVARRLRRRLRRACTTGTPAPIRAASHEARHHRTVRGAELEDAAGEIQLQREQHVRLLRFERLRTTSRATSTGTSSRR